MRWTLSSGRSLRTTTASHRARCRCACRRPARRRRASRGLRLQPLCVAVWLSLFHQSLADLSAQSQGRFEHDSYNAGGDRYSADDLGVRHGSDLGHSGHTLPIGGKSGDRRPSRGRGNDDALSPISRSRENSTSHRDAYPHLSRKTEAKPEYREERRGLVGGSDEDSDDGRGSAGGESDEDDIDDLFVAARAGRSGNAASDSGGPTRL